MRSWLTIPPPTAAVEIAPGRVSAVVVGRQAGAPVVTAHAIEGLPAGAYAASLTAANILQPDVVSGVLRHALDQIGRPRRIALVVPDTVAKVSLVRFEKVPDRTADLDQLIRWQVRKAAPFRAEEAQVSYTPGAVQADGGREFVVAITRRDIVEEYEKVCADAGANAGIVDLASLNLINAALAARRTGGRALESDPADWLLVHITSEYSTLAIIRGSDLIFFRNRPAEGDENLADLVHQTAMYYEDRLSGGGFARVVVVGAAGGGQDADQIRRTLEARLTSQVESIDPRSAAPLRDRISAGPDLLDAIASPIGVLLRELA